MSVKITDIKKQSIIVDYWNDWACDLRAKYEIVLSKNKLSVKEIESKGVFMNSHEVIEEIINTLIDLDTWKKSWYLKVSDYRYNNDVLKKIREIIATKINVRKHDIESLEFALRIIKKRESIEYNVIKKAES